MVQVVQVHVMQVQVVESDSGEKADDTLWRLLKLSIQHRAILTCSVAAHTAGEAGLLGLQACHVPLCRV